MSAPLDPAQRETILSLIARAPEGVAFDQIAQALQPPPEERKLKQWLDALTDEELVMPDGNGRNARYVAVDPVKLLQGCTPATPALKTELRTAVTEAPPAVTAAVADVAPRPAVAVVAAPATALPTEPPTPSDPDFPKMFDMVAPGIVGGAMGRQAALLVLREHAQRNGKGGRAMGAYVKYVSQRLEALTAAEAEEWAITPEEFARWRTQYCPPPAQPKPAAARQLVAPNFALGDGVTDDVAQTEPDHGGDTAPPPRATRASNGDAVPSSRTTPPNRGVDTAAPVSEPDPFSAGELLKSLHHGRSDAYQKRAFEVIKALLTPLRIAICIGIAVALKLSLREIIPFNSAATLIVFPLSGLAWVYFRWLDETEEQPLTAKEAAIVLVAGGVVSVIVANGVISLLMMLEFVAR